MLKILIGESGFSIVQGLILAGIIAGSSLVATRLITDQKIAQKGAETRDQVEDFHNTIYTILQNRLHCRATMVSNSLQSALSASGTPTSTLDLTQIWTHGDPDGNKVVDTTDLTMNNNVKVVSVRLLPQVVGTRTLEIVYRRIDTTGATGLKNGYGARDIKKTMTIRIQRNTMNGNFAGCYAVSSSKASLNSTSSAQVGNDLSKQMCEEMNSTLAQKAFVWDEANSICRPNSQCPANQIYTGIDSIGTVKCRNIEDWVNFNDLLDSTPPNCPIGYSIGFQVDSVLKRVRIICTP